MPIYKKPLLYFLTLLLRHGHGINWASEAVFLFLFKAHKQAHSELCNCLCNAEDGPKGKSVVQFILCTFLGCLLLCEPGVADVVKLKNGRSFAGLIKQETPKSVTINIGMGTITLRRNKIASIQYSENDVQVQTQWQKQYATKAQYVPPTLKNLATEFKTLNAEHSSAKKAQRKNKALQSSIAKKSRKIAAVKENYVNVAQQLNRTPRNQHNINLYNQLVTQQNQLHNTIIILSSALQKETAEEKANRQIVSDYLVSFSVFETVFYAQQQAHENYAKESKVGLFFTEITRQLDAWSAEFQNIPIQHERHGEHFIVQVRINNRLTGRFMLDTGASVITLSPKMAKQLGLKLSNNFVTQVSLANGARQKAFPVILNSVQVGKAKVNNVRAVVLAKAAEQNFDGLLGMSFLKEFSIQLNPSNDSFVLKRFKP